MNFFCTEIPMNFNGSWVANHISRMTSVLTFQLTAQRLVIMANPQAFKREKLKYLVWAPVLLAEIWISSLKTTVKNEEIFNFKTWISSAPKSALVSFYLCGWLLRTHWSSLGFRCRRNSIFLNWKFLHFLQFYEINPKVLEYTFDFHISVT